MRRPRSLATAAALIVAAIFGTASAGHHGAHVVVAPGQPAPRAGPSYLYPDPALTPGVPNPQVTQFNVEPMACQRASVGGMGRGAVELPDRFGRLCDQCRLALLDAEAPGVDLLRHLEDRLRCVPAD